MFVWFRAKSEDRCYQKKASSLVITLSRKLDFHVCVHVVYLHGMRHTAVSVGGGGGDGRPGWMGGPLLAKRNAAVWPHLPSRISRRGEG